MPHSVLRLTLERRRRGWTQRALVRHPDLLTARPRITQPAISEIETGLRVPNASQREALGRAFGIEPAVLLAPAEGEETTEVVR